MLVLSIKESGKKNYVHVKHEKRKKRTYELIEQEAICSRSLNIQDSAWKYWTRDDAYSSVPQMRRQEWNKMSHSERIKCFLDTIAEGKSYNYEIIL